MIKIYKSIVAIPPGETIREELEVLNMTQADFAKRMGMSEKTISLIINGEAPISYDTAMNLESVLGVSASFWNSYETKYRENLKRIEEAENLVSEISILNKLPYKEIVKKGWIQDKKDGAESVRVMKSFFKVSSLNILSMTENKVFNYYFELESNSEGVTLFKKNNNEEVCKYAMATWIRKAENDTIQIETDNYSKEELLKNIPSMKRLSLINSQESITELKELCRKSGIALVIVPHLKKTYVNGVSKWLNKDKALIALSCREKRWDSFWFTFFHEIGHIIKHGKKDLYINADETVSVKIEEEADIFARNQLISNQNFKEIREFPTQENILEMSKLLEIHPSIIVGRLQFEKVIPRTKFSNLIENIRIV